MNKLPEQLTTTIPDNAITVNMKQLCILLGCGRQTAERIATAAGAKRKFGDRSLYVVEPIKKYMASGNE
jgi:hypothetical protein